MFFNIKGIHMNVSDVVKLLEKIPAWKEIKDLPKKITDLENEISELKSKMVFKESCPSCGSQEFPAIRSRNIGVRTYQCKSCQYKETRNIK